MKRILSAILCVSAIAGMSLCGCKKESKVEMNFPDRYEGKTVELMSFADSTLIATGEVVNGKATFAVEENDTLRFPLFTQIAVDGRIRAYYILEEGSTELCDSMSVPTGTPLNNRFSAMLTTLDSIENLDDMAQYLDYAEKSYNANRDNPIGEYFGVEWLKYAEPQRVDSFLNLAPAGFRDTKRVKHYEEFARHRALTSPGMKYTDFEGENERGRKIKFSSTVEPGKYTLVDFWASWCPYCIKELPDMQQLYADYHDKGLNIVGVAVRDKPEDTAAMVGKHSLPWTIVYNTQKVPYDIYGFSGIPHHILIGPDGVIISRGESVEQICTRLEALTNDTEK